MSDSAEVDYKSPWVCGEHFCEECGDCLACYSGDDCYNGAEHTYANDGDEFAFMAFTWHTGADGTPTRDVNDVWGGISTKQKGD